MKTNKLHLWRKNKNPFLGEWSLVYMTNPEDDNKDNAKPVPEGAIVHEEIEDQQKKPEGLKPDESVVVEAVETFRKKLIDDDGKPEALDKSTEDLIKSYYGEINTLEALRRAEAKLDKGDLRGIEFIKWANRVIDSYKIYSRYLGRGFFKNVEGTWAPIAITEDAEEQFEATTDSGAKSGIVNNLKNELKKVLVETKSDVIKRKATAERQLLNTVIDKVKEKVIHEKTEWTKPEMEAMVTTESLKETRKYLDEAVVMLDDLKTRLDNGDIVVQEVLALEDQVLDIYTQRRREILSYDKEINLDDVVKRSAEVKKKVLQSQAVKTLVQKIETKAKQMLVDLEQAEKDLDHAFSKDRVDKLVYDDAKKDLKGARESIAKYVNFQIIADSLREELKAEHKRHADKLVHAKQHHDDEIKRINAEGGGREEIDTADHHYHVEMETEESAHPAKVEEINAKIKEAEGNISRNVNLQSMVESIWTDKSLHAATNDGSKIPKGIDAQIEYAKNLSPFFKKAFLNYINENVDDIEKKFDEDVLENILEKDLNAYDKKIQSFKQSLVDDTPSPAKYKFNLISFSAASRFATKIKEWAVRRYERNQDRVVGEVGEAITKKIRIPGYSDTLSSEFNNLLHHAEGEEVGKYKEILEHIQDPWHVRHVLVTTKNTDEFKAAIEVLVKDGEMRWDEDDFLQNLNRLQRVVFFKNSKEELNRPGLFRQKLQKAFGTMYHSHQLFTEWEKQNLSSYESSKKEFDAECNKMAEEEGGLKRKLAGLLKEYVSDPHHAKVDQHLYEYIIEYAATNGKMSPQQRIYYLIQGMAVGLLAPERGKVLDATLLNKMPALELFNRETGLTMVDIKKIAAIDSAKKGIYEPGVAFHAFFSSNIIHNKSVFERVQKALTGASGAMDHDDFYAYSGALETKVMEELMEKKGNGFTLPKTAMPNATVGFLNYGDILAYTYDGIKDNNLHLARYVNTVLLFNNIANGNMYKSKGPNFFRWGANEDLVKPRAASSEMRGDTCNSWSARQFMEETLKMIEPIDTEGLFKFINTPGGQTDAAVKIKVREINTKFKDDHVFGEPDPQTYDELVSKIGNYVAYVISKDESRVKAMFDNIKARQKSSNGVANAEAVQKTTSIGRVMKDAGLKARFEEGFPPIDDKERLEFERMEAEKKANKGGHGGGGHADEHGGP